MSSSLLSTYLPSGPTFVAGKGALLHDTEGQTWVDLLSGLGVTVLGHSHPRWVAAVQAQSAQLVHTSNLYPQAIAERVASQLTELTAMAGVFFSNSGTEAVECALKLARKACADRRNESFLALEGGFHGRSLGSLSVTANPAYRNPFAPTLSARFVPRNDTQALTHAFESCPPAALIVEPIQGEGGLHELDAGFLQHGRALCDQYGSLLISDEVQCGLGRSGDWVAMHRAGVQPDVLTLAKPLAGGLPVGATLVREPLMGILQPGDHGSTFGGGPLVMAAAEVVLSELTDGGLLDALHPKIAALTQGLDHLTRKHACIQSRQGAGWMQGLAIPQFAREVQSAMAKRGFLVGTAAGDTLRILPPFVLTLSQLDSALSALDQSLSTLPQPQTATA